MKFSFSNGSARLASRTFLVALALLAPFASSNLAHAQVPPPPQDDLGAILLNLGEGDLNTAKARAGNPVTASSLS